MTGFSRTPGVPAKPVSGACHRVVRRAPTRARVRGRRVGLEVVDRAGRRRDPLEPGGNRRIGSHLVPGLVGDPRVGVEGAVGDRVAAADEEVPPGETAFERCQRAGAGLEMARERLRLLGVTPRQAPEAGGADVGLEQVLLEEHPGVDVRALDAIVRQQGRALGQVEQDRAGLGDRRAVLGLEQRRAAGGVPGQVGVGLRVAGEDVDRDALVRDPELREQHPDLEAVGRGREVVESDHERVKRAAAAGCETGAAAKPLPLVTGFSPVVRGYRFTPPSSASARPRARPP